jgi:KDO2-lipid IV(A) lauroyltransferase
MDLQQQQAPGRSSRHRFEGPFYRRLMLGGIRYMPQPLQRATMPLWGGLFYGLIPLAREAVLRNLDVVLGPAPSPLVRHRRGLALFANYAQMLTDMYSVHFGRPLDLEVTSIGREHLLGSLKHGRGVIAATGHLGMWHIGPFLAEWRGLPPFYMAMAAEPNPLVQAFEQRFRDKLRIVYTTESLFSGLELARALRENAIVGLQIDRHLGDHLLPLPMCGHTAYFPSGPATLARATGAPIVPSFFVVEPRVAPGHKRRLLHLLEPPVYVARTSDRLADVTAATAQLVESYGRIVSRYATQWYQFFDFFRPPAPSPAGHRPSPSSLSSHEHAPPAPEQAAEQPAEQPAGQPTRQQ